MNSYTISKELLIEIINKLDCINVHAYINKEILEEAIVKYIPPKDIIKTTVDNINTGTIKNAYHPISEKDSPSLTEFFCNALNYSTKDRLVNYHNKLTASEVAKLLNVTPAAVAYWRKIPDHELKYDVEISAKGKTTHLYDKATVMEFAKKYKRYWHKNKKIIK